jgi:hypothetical protein
MRSFKKVMAEMMDKYDLSTNTKIIELQYKMTAEDYETLMHVIKYPNGIVRNAQPSDFAPPENDGICDCGKPIAECQDAYVHITQGY